MKKIGLLLLSALSFVPISGRAAEPITFGAILPLTGAGGVVGTEEQHGLQLAIEHQNAKGGVDGREIRMLFEDNQAKPDQSVLSFNKLVDLQKVPAIVTGYAGPTLAIAPLATRKKVLVINGAAQADKLADASPYLINTVPVLAGEVDTLIKYLVQVKGKKTAAILWENDAAGISGRDDYRASLAKFGGRVISDEPVQFGQTDFRPALLKLANANPDMLLVVVTSGVAQLADQFGQIDAKFTVAGTTFFSDPAARANPNTNGWIHSQLKVEAPPELAAEYKQKFGTEMGYFARQYYNAMQVLIRCTQQVLDDKKALTGENLRDAVFEIKHFDGLSPTTFTSNSASAQIGIVELRDGHDVTLQTAQSASE
jgi:branched-chain amino acid transport system substrate-binding protein